MHCREHRPMQVLGQQTSCIPLTWLQGRACTVPGEPRSGPFPKLICRKISKFSYNLVDDISVGITLQPQSTPGYACILTVNCMLSLVITAGKGSDRPGNPTAFPGPYSAVANHPSCLAAKPMTYLYCLHLCCREHRPMHVLGLQTSCIP